MSDTILEQLRQGVNKARAGEREEALALFNAVLAERPDHADALVWKAALVSEPDEAIQCLERALRLNPQNKRAKVGLEWAHKRRAASAEAAIPTATPEVEAVTTDAATPVAAEAEKVLPEVPTAPPPEVAPKVVAPRSTVVSNGETKSAPPPYKKRRLSERESHLPPLNLPPEAVAWTRPDRAERAARQRQPAKPTPESPVFRASSPSVVFRIAPQVRQALSGKFPLPGGVQLRWPLLIFGVALLTAFLAFPLNVLAPVLGILAILLAISGVVLFNRARF